QTESYDTEKPEILVQDFSHISEEQITETLMNFVGEIEQKPPIFSALKIDGERAYNLARAGEEVVVKTRKVTINYIENIEINLPFVKFVVGCSKGTYIRSLAHDIGQNLGVGAYLTQLRRTKIGEYNIENASDKFLENDFRFEDYET
ncbi:MAG: tRNA pseudouridine(55) synthase, partial [Bergeyella zoohelcum]|nr:tRNA pseudouridine(55) synthase [Bergeyella zoohelcum]